jgi:site-specific recombinase XerD
MPLSNFLTAGQIAQIFGVSEETVEFLAETGKIPHTAVMCGNSGKSLLRFDFNTVKLWLARENSNPVSAEETIALKTQCETQFPQALQTIRSIDNSLKAPQGSRRKKGYTLSKVPNKELGFVFYVRYIANGKLVPSRWSTSTNNKELATEFALKNRERILTERSGRKTRKKTTRELYHIFETYYAKDSDYLDIDRRRGRALSEKARRIYCNFMTRTFVPYLKQQNITETAEINAPFLARFQNHLLRQNLKPQTINHDISRISQVFKHLVREGCCETNPCAILEPLKIGEDDIRDRGCYNIEKIRGVFNRHWDDHYSYLLCLLIYTTNMRNSEIERIQVRDITIIEGTAFINIPKSKTVNGERIVPLHPFVYRKLLKHIKAENKQPDDYLLCAHGKIRSPRWTQAYHAMGAVLGYGPEQLAGENITFYSGRHFWKTLTNAGDLGDAEEYFMGHRVSADVAQRYNHRDKQGLAKILEKAQDVFTILDHRLFKRTKAAQPSSPPPG